MNKHAKLVLVSDEQRKTIMKETAEWMSNGAALLFSDVVYHAVSEYIANSRGLTIYPSRTNSIGV